MWAAADLHGVASVPLYVCMLLATISAAPTKHHTPPAKAVGCGGQGLEHGQLVDVALAVAPAMPTEPPGSRRY
jgi:hypothetical protein